jgi:hypothetical protein
MKKLSILSAAAFIVLSAIIFYACNPASKASGSRMLAFNLEKGKNYDYEMVWDMNQSLFGQESKVSMGTLYSVNITEEEGETRTMTVTYNKINIGMNVMGMEINIDSDKVPASSGTEDPENKMLGMMSKLFTSIVDRKFILKVNEQGEILEVIGFREMLRDMLKSMNLEGDDYDMGMEALDDQFDDEAIKGQFAQVLSFFPNKEVKVGDSWEKTFTIGSKKMPTIQSSTYSVKDIDGDHKTGWRDPDRWHPNREYTCGQ